MIFTEGQKLDKVAELNSGEDILKYLNGSLDQESAQMELSFKQQDILVAYKERLVTDALETGCPNRDVIQIYYFRILLRFFNY